MKSQKPLSRKENIVVQEMDGEVLIYDLSKNKAFCLNETSALVWQACDGSKTINEIADFVGEKLKSPASEDLIWLALDQLKKEKLIENGNELPNHFVGFSRREAIKKVGLSSLLALPVIMAITSPAAAAACSNLCFPASIGQNCTCSVPPGATPGTPVTCPASVCAPIGGGCLCTTPPFSNALINPGSIGTPGNPNGTIDGMCVNNTAC